MIRTTIEHTPFSQSDMTDNYKEVKFLVLSDTHTALPKEHDKLHPLANLPKADVILHCGDFTNSGTREEIQATVDWLAKQDAELKLLIAGNHEASFDRPFWNRQGGSTAYRGLAINIILKAQAHGIIFLLEDTYELKLSSGAVFRIHASPFTPQFGKSAFQYATNEDRFNPPEDSSRPDWAVSKPSLYSVISVPDIDILMTHGPPKYVLDRTTDGISAGFEHLARALFRTKPQMHCFGHVHGGYGAQRIDWGKSTVSNLHALPKEFVGRNQAKAKGYAEISSPSMDNLRKGKQTLALNAAILDGNGEPTNYPWLVTLSLPVRPCKLELEEIYQATQERIWFGC
jgi:Icc-related predicted phosphoesterase